MSKRKPASIDTVKAEAEKPAVAVKEDGECFLYVRGEVMC